MDTIWLFTAMSKNGTVYSASDGVYCQGVTPSALYGAAVYGVPCSLLTQVRRTAASVAPPYAQGRSLGHRFEFGNH